MGVCWRTRQTSSTEKSPVKASAMVAGCSVAQKVCISPESPSCSISRTSGPNRGWLMAGYSSFHRRGQGQIIDQSRRPELDGEKGQRRSGQAFDRFQRVGVDDLGVIKDRARRRGDAVREYLAEGDRVPFARGDAAAD